jgi:hypothetical protein
MDYLNHLFIHLKIDEIWTFKKLKGINENKYTLYKQLETLPNKNKVVIITNKFRSNGTAHQWQFYFGDKDK